MIPKSLNSLREPRKTLIIPFEVRNDDILQNGDYYGICTGIFDCGTHDSKVANDRKVRMVVFEWTLPDAPVIRCHGSLADGTMRTVYRRFVAELRDRTPLSTFLGCWTGRRIEECAQFDLASLAGRSAVLTIEGSPIKGMRNRVLEIKPSSSASSVCPLRDLKLSYVVWSITDAQSVDDFGHLPKMARDMCAKSYEAKSFNKENP